ncbi:MAG: hypothetical protein KAI53_05885, partial [Candidatus Aenigmarchaeota archaeon]|nr:hypothetical protein [Candidatus Aenigmarchaeota archaeon]
MVQATNTILIFVAILIMGSVVLLAGVSVTDKAICADINSLTKANAFDLASSLKYVSHAAAAQVVKKYNFADLFEAELTEDRILVTYAGSCAEGASTEIEHNLLDIEESVVEGTKEMCVKKIIVDCETKITICDASVEGCCDITPVSCGGVLGETHASLVLKSTGYKDVSGGAATPDIASVTG